MHFKDSYYGFFLAMWACLTNSLGIIYIVKYAIKTCDDEITYASCEIERQVEAERGTFILFCGFVLSIAWVCAVCTSLKARGFFENYRLQHIFNDADDCSICLEPFDEEVVAVVHCGHVFHQTCIDQWLQVRPSCPLCCASTAIVQLDHASIAIT